MTELPPLILESEKAGPVGFPNSTGSPSSTTCKTPAAITFVRNRMFYARAALNAKGKVTFGLRHIREFTSVYNMSDLMLARRFKSIWRLQQERPYNSCDEVHFSKAIWFAQCFHIRGRLQGDRSVFQRLHPARARDYSIRTQSCIDTKGQ